MRVPKATSSPDLVFIATLFIIVIFGFVILASASSDLAKERFGNSYYYLIKQIINGLVFGSLGFLAGAFIYYHRWAKFALLFLGISILTLILVFTPLSLETKGSVRWLQIGNFSFQPSELLKLTFILYVASWLSRNLKRSRGFFEGFVPFLCLIGITGFLIIKQPATTAAVIIFLASILTYFAGGARKNFLALLFLIGVLALALIIIITPYRKERILNFFQPEKADVLDEGYHRNQALTAIGSGGLMGVGYGHSTTKLKYLPEPIGDSIFAVVAEELGFIGASFLIILFLMLIFRGFMIAKHAPDTLGRLLVTGFTSIIGFQVFINIGAISGLLPLTGVSLPFVSYGGTAFAMFMTMSGIIVNVSRYRR